jgi:hypothetical protein
MEEIIELHLEVETKVLRSTELETKMMDQMRIGTGSLDSDPMGLLTS